MSLWFCVTTTIFALSSLWFISPLNERTPNDVKCLWMGATLGSPLVFTLLCILSWVSFFL